MAIAILAAVVFASPSAGRADPAIDSVEQEFLNLINEYRAQKGAGPLVLNDQLNAAADWLSEDMGKKGYFSHYDSLGRDPNQRAAAFGYPYSIGENIAGGYNSAQAVFDAWRASPGHNWNMLYAGYKTIGIGRVYVAGSTYKYYWTTDFGGVITKATATPTPAPPAVTPAPMPTPTPSPAPTALNITPQPTPTATPAATPAPASAPTPAPTPKPPIAGDLNCDGGLTAADALIVLRVVADITPGPACGASPDVNCDGAIDSVDALELLRYVAGLSAVAGPGCALIGGF
jgi:hypothetical protein